MTSLEDFRKQYPQYDNLEDSDLAARLHAKFYKDIPIADYVKQVGVDVGKYDPTLGMSQFEKFKAGVGAGAARTIRGVKQVFGQSDQKDEAQARSLEAPLMKTGAGQAGEVTGAIASLAPASLIPGAGTALGAIAIGAGSGALQPTVEGESRGQNAVVGGITGAAGKAVGNIAAKKLTDLAAKSTARAAAKTAAAAPMVGAVNEAQRAGYRLPPTQANPSLLNQFLEGVSGKIKTQQAASTFNQENTNKLVKQALGLPAGQPVTPQALEGIRKSAGTAYEALRTHPTAFNATPEYQKTIQNLGREWDAAAKEFPELVNNQEIKTLVKSLDRPAISPNAAVQIIKKLRFDSQANLRGMDNPEKLALGRAQRKAAEAIEDMVDQNLTGSPLLENYRAARQVIAKSYDVEGALNEATGNVSARKLARLLDRGKPLSAELRQAARFAKAFPKAAQDVDTIGSQTAISPLDVAAGLIGAGTAHNPMAGAAMATRPGIRALLMSKLYQEKMARAPSYSPSRGLALSAKAANRPELSRAAPYALSEAVLRNREEQ